MAKLDSKIQRLKLRLAALGPFHPGKVTLQYNTCGKPNCRCKDKQSPQKHGPYYLLSYAVGKRHSTRFVKASELRAVRKRIAEYEAFKKTVGDLTEAYVEWSKYYGFMGEADEKNSGNG